MIARVAIALTVVTCSVWGAPRQAKEKGRQQAHAVNAELTIVAANVQMLLIAPDGKETGYDPKLQKQVRTVPGSAYYQDALLAYDSGRVDPNTTQTIDVGHAVAGTYKLVVSAGTAAEGEEYEVRIRLSRRDGSEAAIARITGTAEREKPASYELRVSVDPGGVTVVHRPGDADSMRR